MNRYAQILWYLSTSPLFFIDQSINTTVAAMVNNNTAPLPLIYERFGRFVYPWVEADLFQQASTTTTPRQFNASVSHTSQFLQVRALDVAVQTDAYRPTAGSASWLSTPVMVGIIVGACVAVVVVVVVVFRVRRSAARRAQDGYYIDIPANEGSHYY
jgi:hypothetical protein